MNGIAGRLLFLSVAALTATLLAAQPVAASLPTPASGATWGQNQRVEYRWKEGAEPPAWAKRGDECRRGTTRTTAATRRRRWSRRRDNGTSWVAYTGDIPTNWAIGYTTTYIPNYFTMRLRPQGYPLDWGSLRWCQFYDSPPTGCYDAEMITLHEFGHVQTLDHPDDADVTDWTDTIMHWAPKTKAKAGWNQHEFGRCDVARLQIRYEPLTSSTPISTCLDLETDLSLSTNMSSVSSGASVTLTARLNVADDVMWPLLASEPLAARQINIQRRAIGSSTWSAVGSMAVLDDTGRYTKTLTVTDSFDYRAVFSSPANEGLEGTTSLVVRINVSSGGGECAHTQSNPGGHGQMYPC